MAGEGSQAGRILPAVFYGRSVSVITLKKKNPQALKMVQKDAPRDFLESALKTWLKIRL
jgi:hypothetical protein